MLNFTTLFLQVFGITINSRKPTKFSSQYALILFGLWSVLFLFVFPTIPLGLKLEERNWSRECTVGMAPSSVACKAPLFMGFPRQEYWSRLPYPPPGDLPDPDIKPAPLMSPALAGSFLALVPPEKPINSYAISIILQILDRIHPGDLPNPGIEPGLPHCRQTLYHLSYQGSHLPNRRYESHRFNPWVWKVPWRKAWQPTPVFLPGESHGHRSLSGYSPWGHTKSWTEAI